MSDLQSREDFLKHEQINFNKSIKKFYISDIKKCLVIKTLDSKHTVIAVKSALMEIESEMNQVTFIKLHDLAAEAGQLKLIPKLTRVTVLEIHQEDGAILQKLIHRVGVSLTGKLILVSCHDMDQVVEPIEDLVMKMNTGDRHQKGNTPLHEAVIKNNLNLALNIMKNQTIKDNDHGHSPLDLASWYGHHTLVLAILENYSNIRLEKALIFAAKLGHVSVLTSLIEYGCQIDQTNEDSSTALHIAVQHGHYFVVYFLVKNKANLNLKDYRGRTPLHLAAMGGFLDILKLLLENDVCLDQKDENEKTPLDLARLYRKKEVVHVLKRWLEERSVLRQAIDIIRRRSWIQEE